MFPQRVSVMFARRQMGLCELAHADGRGMFAAKVIEGDQAAAQGNRR